MFKYPVICKKNFQILILFIEINVNVCLLCDHHLTIGINLHTRRPTCQLKVSYALGFIVSSDFFFAFWGAEMHVIHIGPFCTSRNVLKNFRCLDVSNRVRNWNKVKKTFTWGQNCHYVSADFLFSHFEELKSTFFTSFHFAPRDMY